MTMNSFKDFDLDIRYTTPEDIRNGFYVPVFGSAVRIDRKAGYFTSGGLAAIARGLPEFIANKGKLRIIVSHDLTQEDVDIVTRGKEIIEVSETQLLRILESELAEEHRVNHGILAGMLQNEMLEIKVCVPWNDNTGYQRSDRRIFHSKDGVAWDRHENCISWIGSDNFSWQGITGNYESLSVFRSWIDSETDRANIKETEDDFNQLWCNEKENWKTLSLSQAVIEKLLEISPPTEPWPPDPNLQIVYPPDPVPPSNPNAIKAQWLLDVPKLVGVDKAHEFPVQIKPWPHQIRVARDIVDKFPDRFLLADEVGLGKTIEAGLALRELILTGLVKRALILAPKSVLAQWQGELWEKFGLSVPLYDAKTLIWPNGVEIDIGDGDPWDPVYLQSRNAPPHPVDTIVLISSQLAKRTDWRARLFKAPDWDMVIVDEAHHARRKEPSNRASYQPNRLLQLLDGINEDIDDEVLPVHGLALRTKSLILLTATPMQIDPVEVWDLLNLFGMPGEWGRDPNVFQIHHEHMEFLSTGSLIDIDWNLIVGLAADERSMEEIAERFAQILIDEFGSSHFKHVDQAINDRSIPQVRQLYKENFKRLIYEVVKHLTPLRRKMHRYTRRTLREYIKKGLLDANLADRNPEPVWVELSSAEQQLYNKVEDYIANFYKKYQDERPGLGFVMTIYRRRLTSSFKALEKSLERRRLFLEGMATESETIQSEDIEDDSLTFDLDDNLDQDDAPKEKIKSIHREEIEYVERFLREIRDLHTDTKLNNLRSLLTDKPPDRKTVVLFTQYTDTMDYLREELTEWRDYGKIGCYSGRGGEKWNSVTQEWEVVTKQQIRNEFRKGDLTILMGTDAMAEGLNLQTCGMEINYDVPWNPMRLEQRIGRVDRIGQDFDDIFIHNYFIEGTIEAKVYQRLHDRIEWFQGVVGPLQPILTEITKMQRELSMLSREEQAVKLEEEAIRIEGEVEKIEESDPFSIDDFEEPFDEDMKKEPIVSSDQIRQFFTTAEVNGARFEPETGGCFRLVLDGNHHLVAFDEETASKQREEVTVLDWGSKHFEDILNKFGSAPENQTGIIRVESTRGGRERVGWYRVDGESTKQLSSWRNLEAELAAPNPAAGSDTAQAESAFRIELEAEEREINERFEKFWKEGISSTKNKIRHLLTQAYFHCLVKNVTLEDRELKMPSPHDVMDVLDREGQPFSQLIRRIGGKLDVSEEDPDWETTKKKGSNQAIVNALTAMKREGERLLLRLNHCEQSLDILKSEQSDPIKTDLTVF